MPTYEYKCEKCGHEMEAFQSITAGPLRKCPECGKSSLQRLISVGAGVIFKGGGFYQTDYRSEGYKKSAEAETKAAEPAKADCGKSACACKPAAETKAEKPKKSKAGKKEAA
jgi:putative FmdB family regulatory protein